VKRWVRRKRETGSLEPAKRRYGPRPFANDERTALLLELLAERNDWTLQELADAWGERCGKSVSADTVGRTLAKLGYTRKKRRPTP
jgi:transposase